MKEVAERGLLRLAISKPALRPHGGGVAATAYWHAHERSDDPADDDGAFPYLMFCEGPDEDVIIDAVRHAARSPSDRQNVGN